MNVSFWRAGIGHAFISRDVPGKKAVRAVLAEG